MNPDQQWSGHYILGNYPLQNDQFRTNLTKIPSKLKQIN